MEYNKLCQLYDEIQKTTKHIEKTYLISKFLKSCTPDNLGIIALLIQGNIFPRWDPRKIGVSSMLVIKVLSMLGRTDEKKIAEMFSKKGDLGDVSEEITKTRTQKNLFSEKLSIKYVYDTMSKIETYTGKGSVDFKIKSIANLLLSSTPTESKYITRTILGELRVGVGNGILRDAIAWAFLPKAISKKNTVATFGICPKCKEIVPTSDICISCKNKIDRFEEPKDAKSIKNYDDLIDNLRKGNKIEYYKSESQKQINEKIIDTVQYAYDISNDFSEIAKTAQAEGLLGIKKISLKPLRPLNLMLFIKAKELKDALEGIESPAALEYKYDGFRLQIHKSNGKIRLFTRRLEDVTDQFPDIVESIKENVKGDEFILDSEAVARDKEKEKYLPFQNISQRIKRKYDIAKLIKSTPVEVNVFDILYYNKKDLTKQPFSERRKKLEQVINEVKYKIVLSTQKITSDLKKANKFYKESLAAGNEGIMVKSQSAKYIPGRRVGQGFKVKPIMETLDLVVVGAEWGEGKRKGLLTAYTLACLNNEGNYQTIGKVGSGFKELKGSGVTFSEMNELLGKIIIKTSPKFVEVKPEIILEIAYEELQKSPSYTSGFALRFPRVIRIRDDLNPNEISDIKLIKYLYKTQRKRDKTNNQKN